MSQRLRFEISGSVQGVGFRPFVFRLAHELGLSGWVSNDAHGVTLEVQGDASALQRFSERLGSDAPAAAVIEHLGSREVPVTDESGFHIRPSRTVGAPTVQMLADLASCPDCLRELRDPDDRRHRYPFTNCTQCGPRFSIILSLPYDRPRTTMDGFSLCPACRREYEDPHDRRFHAQPNACPRCGPGLQLWDRDGFVMASRDNALRETARALRRGRIVAVKGLGGFHLMVDARSDAAIARLRSAKPRREKPFALMLRDVEQARLLCQLDTEDERVLTSTAAPILLLARRHDAPIAEGVAPGNPYLGVMLPYTPLHHLLLRAVDFPLVATSGNLSDEPICTDEQEARVRLRGVAEAFLVHDRPIARHVDDSVVWRVQGERRLLRRARGFAPRPVLLRRELPVILAVGAHLKCAVALGVGRRAFISQHIGDMETPEALGAFERVIADFLRLYEAHPVAVAHDLHPDYATTRWARTDRADTPEETMVRLNGLPRIAVQHHHAHFASCLADNDCEEQALGVIWDGTGYGSDGTVWGGEFLLGDAAGFTRVAHLLPFRLPGGEAAVREPRRTALALLWELYGEGALSRDDLPPLQEFSVRERELLGAMLGRGVNCPLTTSAGRLFDGVAALIGLQQRTSFEGQAAMSLEHVAKPGVDEAYPLELRGDDLETGTAHAAGTPLVLDWRGLLEALLEDVGRGIDAGRIAARFHNALVKGIVEVAAHVGASPVALSGGCFQNRWLVEHGTAGLRRAGLEPLLQRRVPPNDGGIALGQLSVAGARLAADS